jgi:hypothetical protein
VADDHGVFDAQRPQELHDGVGIASEPARPPTGQAISQPVRHDHPVVGRQVIGHSFPIACRARLPVKKHDRVALPADFRNEIRAPAPRVQKA